MTRQTYGGVEVAKHSRTEFLMRGMMNATNPAQYKAFESAYMRAREDQHVPKKMSFGIWIGMVCGVLLWAVLLNFFGGHH